MINVRGARLVRAAARALLPPCTEQKSREREGGDPSLCARSARLDHTPPSLCARLARRPRCSRHALAAPHPSHASQLLLVSQPRPTGSPAPTSPAWELHAVAAALRPAAIDPSETPTTRPGLSQRIPGQGCHHSVPSRPRQLPHHLLPASREARRTCPRPRPPPPRLQHGRASRWSRTRAAPRAVWPAPTRAPGPPPHRAAQRAPLALRKIRENATPPRWPPRPPAQQPRWSATVHGTRRPLRTCPPLRR
eukprot:scaffold16402_cov118-Isochrysis_galbana.AAC.2